MISLRDGKLALPEGARMSLGLKPGDPVMMEATGGCLILRRATPRPADTAWRRPRLAPVLPLRAVPAQPD